MATAYVLINCELGSEEAIISQLKTTSWQKLNRQQSKHYVKQLLGRLEK